MRSASVEDVDGEDPAPPSMFYAENPEWEDEETLDDTAPSPDELGELPSLHTSPTRPPMASIPIYDNCRMLMIVHTNGVHELSVTFCRWLNAQREDIQLLTLGYFPASRLRPSTAFTFECLDLRGDVMCLRTSIDLSLLELSL